MSSDPDRASVLAFEEFAEHAPVGIYRTTPEGQILFANPALVRMLGFESLEELRERDLAEDGYAVPVSRREFRARIERDGAVRGYEVAWRRRDGSLVHLSENARAVRDERGEVFCYEGTVEDISARREVEDRLRESELRYRQLIETLPQGVAIVQHDRIVFANARLAHMVGLDDPVELLGEASTVGLAEEDHARVLSLVLDALEHDGPWPVSFQSTSVRDDGTTFPSECYCSRISLGQERALQFVITDISDRVAAEREREALLTQVTQLDKLSTIGQLAAGVAHEINNPLTYALPTLQELTERCSVLPGLTEACERGGNRPDLIDTLRADGSVSEIPEMLLNCVHAMERVRDVTRDLHQFARIDDASVERVTPQDLVEAPLRLLARELRYRAEVVRVYGDAPEVAVNRGKLGQVLLNILMNALQAMDDDTPERNKIWITTGRRDEQLLIEIANNGAPIPLELRDRVFDPFFTTKPQGHGTGLGLAISASVVHQHGGVLELDEDERGTVFRILLPQGLERHRTIARGAPNPELASGGARILIIDDEPLILRTFQRALRDHVVVTASSGEEALQRLERDADFDLIICDLLMPEISGMDVHAWVQQRKPQLASKILFVTGGAYTSRARDFLSQTDNPRLDKPVNNALLKTTVAELLQT